MTEFTVIQARQHVSYAILKNLSDTSICWPKAEDLPAVSDAFNNLRMDDNFPGIVGALDGSHIPVSTPVISPDSYFNRKKFHSSCCG